jgi:hypothetical protein
MGVAIPKHSRLRGGDEHAHGLQHPMMILSFRLGAFAIVAVVLVAAAVAAPAVSTSGRAGAPGQVCSPLKVKAKKTDEQRATFKKCIQDAGVKRKADRAAEAGKDGAPGQVCKHLKVKGRKTDEQRAAFKECIQDAVAKRKG